MNPIIDGILETAHAEGRTALLEHEVYQILSQAGLDVPRHVFWPGSPAAEPPEGVRRFLDDLAGREVVLKIVSPQILHKSDVGGLAFSPGESGEALSCARRIWEETGRRAPGADRRGLLLTEKVESARGGLDSELLLSAKQDPAFGATLVLGFGGVLTEWFGDFSRGGSTVILQPGAVRRGIRQLLHSSPMLSFLFSGSRLHPVPPLDLEVTSDRLESLGRILTAYDSEASGTRFTLEELEMNPMLLTRDGRWVAVDGIGRFSERKVALAARPIRKVSQLLQPRSALVLGASSRGLNPGRIILRNLKTAEGLEYGRLYAIHPKESAIDGIPCRRTFDDLPGKVDMAVVAVPAEGARDSIRALCEMNLAESIILIPGGFAETGRQGLETEIVDTLRASRALPGEGPVMIGGNCLGIVSKRQYNTFFLPQYKLPFHDAPGDNLVVISQSGAYLVTLSSNLDGIIFPLASISFGNQMDLTVSDFLEYYLDDPGVQILACYVEGFKPLDGKRFLDLARRLHRKGKRVIAFKAGKTALGAKATQSHTASLAGDYAVARLLMQQAEVIVTDTLNMFEDYTKVFTMLWHRVSAARQEAAASGSPSSAVGARVGIISNAGFECSTVLDTLYNLKLATLSPPTLAKLRACLPDIAHADNPVDATPMATTVQFIEAAEALLGDPGVDALLVSSVPVTPTLDNLAPDLAGSHSENIFARRSLPQELLRLFRETSKPMAVSVDSGRLYDDFVILLERGGIPTFRKVDRASRALSALATL